MSKKCVERHFSDFIVSTDNNCIVLLNPRSANVQKISMVTFIKIDEFLLISEFSKSYVS